MNTEELLFHQKPELHRLAQQIVAATNADLVICYGCRSTSFNRWSPFRAEETHSRFDQVNHYDLLIVLPDSEKRPKQALRNLIAKLSTPLLEVQCTFEHCFNLIVQLEAIDPFITALYLKGIHLHVNSQAGLPPIASITPPQAPTADLDEELDVHILRAEQAIAIAGHARKEHFYREAIPLLREAVIQTCQGLILSFTNHRSSEHEPSRLLALTENFCDLRATIFPCITVPESALLKALDKGYTAHDPATLSEEVMIDLQSRVTRFYQLAHGLWFPE